MEYPAMLLKPFEVLIKDSVSLASYRRGKRRVTQKDELVLL
jgi:hypothetical protein